MQTQNMIETMEWLRERGFIVGTHRDPCVLVRGAISALSQPHTFPGDIALAISFLKSALATLSLPDDTATDSE